MHQHKHRHAPACTTQNRLLLQGAQTFGMLVRRQGRLAQCLVSADAPPCKQALPHQQDKQRHRSERDRHALMRIGVPDQAEQQQQGSHGESVRSRAGQGAIHLMPLRLVQRSFQTNQATLHALDPFFFLHASLQRKAIEYRCMVAVEAVLPEKLPFHDHGASHVMKCRMPLLVTGRRCMSIRKDATDGRDSPVPIHPPQQLVLRMQRALGRVLAVDHQRQRVAPPRGRRHVTGDGPHVL